MKYYGVVFANDCAEYCTTFDSFAELSGFDDGVESGASLFAGLAGCYSEELLNDPESEIEQSLREDCLKMLARFKANGDKH